MSERPLKVLSVCTSDSTGGAARAAYRIQQAARELGVDSRMFVKQKGIEDPYVLPLSDFLPVNSLYKGLDWARNKVKNKWQHFQWGKYPNRQQYYMSDLRSTDIGHALQKIDYDILHLHWVNLRFLPLSQLPKDKPIVWTLHDSWPFCGVCHLPLECKGYHEECGSCPMLGSSDPNDLSHRVWQKKKKIFDSLDLHIVAPSHWMADCARQSSLFKDRNISVIPNCIDTDLFSPGDRREACKKLGLDPGKKHILFGAMNALRDPNKGFKYLVEAISSLNSDLKNNADLVVFGANDSVDMKMTGINTHNLGILRDNTDIITTYRAADVTVIPSLSENLSCTIMESLFCGTPVNAFGIGGNSDMIDHKKNGYLATEKDCEDLAQGIAYCMNHELDLVSETARQKMLECFSCKAVGQQYSTLYNKLKHSIPCCSTL